MTHGQGKADQKKRQKGRAEAPAQLLDLRDKLADRAILSGAIVVVRRLVHDIGGGNEYGEQHRRADDRGEHLPASVHKPFPPSLKFAIILHGTVNCQYENQFQFENYL